jgi:hypothetical protein
VQRAGADASARMSDGKVFEGHHAQSPFFTPSSTNDSRARKRCNSFVQPNTAPDGGVEVPDGLPGPSDHSAEPSGGRRPVGWSYVASLPVNTGDVCDPVMPVAGTMNPARRARPCAARMDSRISRMIMSRLRSFAVSMDSSACSIASSP